MQIDFFGKYIHIKIYDILQLNKKQCILIQNSKGSFYFLIDFFHRKKFLNLELPRKCLDQCQEKFEKTLREGQPSIFLGSRGGFCFMKLGLLEVIKWIPLGITIDIKYY